MSKELGATLPKDLLDFLSSTEPGEKFKQVILFSTTDEDGWPRHGLLSAREVVAKDSNRLLLLLYSNSHGTANLQREGKISLVLVNSNMSYYVLCTARPLDPLPDAPSETLFELTVERVLEDSLATAKILSGITFEGYDPGMTQENRKIVFQQLVDM
ncbi:MAG: hypothetical protein IH796_08050 [Deltaproteobacteria bacterium]|nr:hypothetical protein [Deltaproteobacteria bacterium]